MAGNGGLLEDRGAGCVGCAGGGDTGLFNVRGGGGYWTVLFGGRGGGFILGNVGFCLAGGGH